ncbi:sigma-70 family RNA polymerase sigma factor [Methylobacterium nonmethylotrophicum]|uniref:sigma-70 family RNA polymerase sigma factor n=1 Tax=Methylobacterium nonmethylotrophicum TaxID=1141884 RepID=UPI001FDEABCC|nr:sigma-70 family RNA polymerase sigma factor [Methylobacterium nonmethylotrophicum]
MHGVSNTARAALSVEETLRHVAGGDRGALRALYEAEAPRMLGVALRILRRRALAEEAVQDAFVQVWRNAGSFDPARGTGRAFLYAVLRYRALNILRGEARTDLTDELDYDVASEEEGPEAVVARLSEARALRRCLDGLEPHRRNAIVLAYAHGLSHGELAGRLGLPLGTVKSWLRRSLLALRECMS